LVPLRLLVGPLEPRHRLEALPDPADVILLQLILHLRPVDIYLPDLHPQLPLHGPEILFVTRPKDPVLLEEGLYLRVVCTRLWSDLPRGGRGDDEYASLVLA